MSMHINYTIYDRDISKTWINDKDKVLQIKDMSTDHIINCLNLLQRKGYNKLKCLVEGNKNGVLQIKGFETELKRRANECPKEF